MPPTPATPPLDRRPERAGPSATLLRLRRGVDMLGVVTSLCSASWLVYAPNGGGPSVATLAVAAVVTLASGVALTIGISTTVRSTRRAERRAARTESRMPGRRRSHRAPTGGTAGRAIEEAGICSASPILTVAVASAMGTATYVMLRADGADVPSIAIMVVAGLVLAAKESLCLINVSRYAEHLQDGQARLSSLVAQATDVIMICDADLVVRWQSPASARLFGLADADVLGRTLTALVHPADVGAVSARLAAILAARPGAAGAPEVGGTATPAAGSVPLIAARLRDGFGRWRDTESTVSDQRSNPYVRALVLQVRDVSDRKALERSRHQLDWTDGLTGLANQRRLLHVAGELAAAGGRGGALMLIELEGVRALNDLRSLGGLSAGKPPAGDEVLVEAARRLLGSIGDRDLAARTDGSGLAVLTDALPISAYALATRLVATLGRPYPLGSGATAHIAVSIGVAELDRGTPIEDTLRRADLARQRAAQLGGCRVESFDESIEAALVRRVAIERELPGALARGELDLVYQPVLELDNQQPVGVEALLRWRHPELGVVCPVDVIPVAEHLGISGEIGEWVLQRACRQLSLWRMEGRDLWMSVNVWPRQLCESGFLPTVTTALNVWGIPPERLVVELPEHHVPAEDRTIPRQLAALRSLGVRTAIDNFGVAQAALANLRRLPLDILKADRALFAGAVDAAPRTRTAAPVLDAVVEMSRRLGIEVIATGLTDAEQLDLARAAGARFGQGFLLAAPEHAERVEAFLESHRMPRM